MRQYASPRSLDFCPYRATLFLIYSLPLDILFAIPERCKRRHVIGKPVPGYQANCQFISRSSAFVSRENRMMSSAENKHSKFTCASIMRVELRLPSLCKRAMKLMVPWGPREFCTHGTRSRPAWRENEARNCCRSNAGSWREKSVLGLGRLCETRRGEGIELCWMDDATDFALGVKSSMPISIGSKQIIVKIIRIIAFGGNGSSVRSGLVLRSRPSGAIAALSFLVLDGPWVSRNQGLFVMTIQPRVAIASGK